MRKLWDFVVFYPNSSSRFFKRRILSEVRLDLKWWNELISAYNGVQFFDTQTRKIVQLYTDVLLHGLGGFYYEHDTCCVSEFIESIPQTQVFAVPVLITYHINIDELEAILLAVKAWGAH